MKYSINYARLSEVAKRLSNDRYGLRALETSLARHYTNGTITESEFKRLDLMVFDRLVALDLKEEAGK